MAHLYTLSGEGLAHFSDINEDPLSGGKIYFYEVGTSTPVDTYSNIDGSSANTNPVILDSRGNAEIYIVDTVKMVVKDSLDNLLYTVPEFGEIEEEHVSEWDTKVHIVTYIDADEFSVVGDHTTHYQVHRRVQAILDSGAIYGAITDSVYSGGVTTVTVDLDGAGALDATLSAVWYGLLSATNPSMPENIIYTVADATDRDHAVNAGQIQDGGVVYAADTGAVNVLTIALAPVVTAYVAGQLFRVKVKLENTTTDPTLNVNTVGALEIKRNSGIYGVTTDVDINKLKDSGAHFTSELVGKKVYNSTDNNYATVSAVDSATQLSIDTDIFTSGEAYQILDDILVGDLPANMDALFLCTGPFFVLLNPSRGSEIPYVIDTGAADAYVADFDPTIHSLYAGLVVNVKIINANTITNPTINVNGLGTKTIKNNSGSALIVGEIKANAYYALIYNGTDFILSVVGVVDGSITGAKITKTVLGTGSQAVGASSSWTPSAGVYQTMIESNSSPYLQLYISATWRGDGAGGSSALTIADGSNMRYYNSTAGSETLYYQTF